MSLFDVWLAGGCGLSFSVSVRCCVRFVVWCVFVLRAVVCSCWFVLFVVFC